MCVNIRLFDFLFLATSASLEFPRFSKTGVSSGFDCTSVSPGILLAHRAASMVHGSEKGHAVYRTTSPHSSLLSLTATYLIKWGAADLLHQATPTSGYCPTKTSSTTSPVIICDIQLSTLPAPMRVIHLRPRQTLRQGVVPCASSLSESVRRLRQSDPCPLVGQNLLPNSPTQTKQGPTASRAQSGEHI